MPPKPATAKASSPSKSSASKSAAAVSSSPSSLSRTVARQSTMQNFLVSLTAWLVSISVLRRTSWMLFGDAHGQFAFAPDFDLSYGYAGQAAIDAVGVKGLSFMGRLVLLLATAVNVIHIGSFATLAAITITNGVKALGEKGLAFRDLNLIPFVTLTLHAAETVVLFLGLNAGSASLAGLAGMIGYARGVTSVITLASVVGGGGLFLQSWATGIGRDGRQKIN